MLAGLQHQPACVTVFFFLFFFFVKLFCGSYLKGVSNLSTLVLLWLKLNTLTSLNLSPTFPWTTSLKAYFERLQKAWGGASGALQTGKKWAVLALPDGAVWFFFRRHRRRARLRRKHVHRPGADLHSQAAAAAAALHLLGNADLGHLYFKLVPNTHTLSNTHRCTEKVRNVRKVWRGKDRELLGALRGGWMCLEVLFPGYMHNTIITEVLFQCGCSHLCSMYVGLYIHNWIGRNAFLCLL